MSQLLLDSAMFPSSHEQVMFAPSAEVNLGDHFYDSSQSHASLERQQRTMSPSTESSSRAHNQPGKLFIGGLSPETTRDRLLEYFSNFGEVVDCVVMTDALTGRTRGFGFVTYRDGRCCELVLAKRPHHIDGREVDPKVAVPRQEMETSPRAPRDVRRKPRSVSFTHHVRKVFVGGLPNTTTIEVLTRYFGKFGAVEDAVIIHDKQTRLPRGFGFVTFVEPAAAERVVKVHYHDFYGKLVEVKRAEPKVESSRSPPARGLLYSDQQHPRFASHDPWLGSGDQALHYLRTPADQTAIHFHEGRRRSFSARALLEEDSFNQARQIQPQPMTRVRSRSFQPNSGPWYDPFNSTDLGQDAERAVDKLVSPQEDNLWSDFGNLTLNTPPATATEQQSLVQESGTENAFLTGMVQGHDAWANASK